jgi:hypothetical protein
MWLIIRWRSICSFHKHLVTETCMDIDVKFTAFPYFGTKVKGHIHDPTVFACWKALPVMGRYETGQILVVVVVQARKIPHISVGRESIPSTIQKAELIRFTTISHVCVQLGRGTEKHHCFVEVHVFHNAMLPWQIFLYSHNTYPVS